MTRPVISIRTSATRLSSSLMRQARLAEIDTNAGEPLIAGVIWCEAVSPLRTRELLPPLAIETSLLIALALAVRHREITVPECRAHAQVTRIARSYDRVPSGVLPDQWARLTAGRRSARS